MSRLEIENVADAYPLTSLQQGMLYHVVTGSDEETYVSQAAYEIADDIDVDAFRGAWDAVIERHEALRSSFVWDGVDRPLQIVHDHVELNWEVEDLRTLDPARRESTVESRLAFDRTQGIDITRAPLMRMYLARLTDDRWWWMWTSHHLIADAWSVQVILAEVRVLYGHLIRGVAPSGWERPPRFADFVARQPAKDDAALEAHWRERLAGFNEPHRLDAPGLLPAVDAAGHGTIATLIDSQTTAEIEHLSRAYRVTTASVISAAWALVLSRWSRTDDVVFGITSSGRDPSIPDIDEAVGLYINTVPCRIAVDPSQPFGRWLPSVHEAVRDTLRHDQTPLTSIQRWSDVRSGDPLFESIVVIENVPETPGVDDAITIRPLGYTEHSNYPVAVLATPGDQLELRMVHDASVVSTEAARSAVKQLATVLTTIASAPDTRISSISLVADDDIERLTDLASGEPLLDDERTVHAFVEEQARSTPDATAVATASTSISYRRLDERANALAHDLVTRGVEPGDLVGVHVQRSIDTITAFLAVLKAGAAYVPLDPTYPADHIAGLIAGSHIRVILSTSLDAHLLPPGLDVIPIDTFKGIEPKGPAVVVTSDSVAYVIYTSGSTGEPKGVAITHGNLVRSTTARPAHYGDPVGRFLLLSSFSFDSSVAGIYWSLFTGGTLVLPAAGDEHDIETIIDHIRGMSITHLLCLPALYRLILAEAPDDALASLKVAIVAGEASPPGLLAEHRASVPHTELHNEYGPTEATVWC
ncbi:MAG: condensation domain-containing protein, partial [Acidimicrobiia bacterium]